MNKRILEYLLYHPNSKFVNICTDLNIDIDTCKKDVDYLLSKSLIQGMGYSSHVEEYFVVSKPAVYKILGE